MADTTRAVQNRRVLPEQRSRPLVLAPGLALHVRPAMVQLAGLMRLAAGDLADRVQAELTANPALELADVRTCGRCAAPIYGRFCPHCSGGSGLVVEPVATPSARAELLADLLAVVEPGDRVVARFLVADLDRHGILDRPLDQFARDAGCTLSDARRVVAALRTLAPGGAAVDPVEAFRLAVHAAGLGPLADDLVGSHLADLAAGEYTRPARQLGVESAEVRAIHREIRRQVRPFPLDLDDVPVARRYTDAVVMRDGAELRVELTDGPWNCLRVAESYAVHPTGGGARELARARQFLELLADRQRTLLRVVQTVVAHQSDRVLNGPGGHRPLTRRAVAVELGLHESTVGRAVTGKTVRLPKGEIVALTSLFGVNQAALECLGELIRAAGPGVGDAHLAAQLGVRGFPVARRTVGKYRGLLGLPAIRFR